MTALDKIENIIDSDFFNNSPTSSIVFKNKCLSEILTLSKNIKTLTAYKKEEFISNNILFQNLISKEYLELILKKINSEQNKNFELPIFSIIDKNNESKYIKASIHIENDLYIMYLNDITKEQNQLKNQDLLNLIIYNLPDLLWIKDLNGVYLICNKRFEEFFGATKEKIIGKTDYDFVDKDLGDFFREHDLKAINSTIPVSNFEELTFKNDKHKEYCLTVKTKLVNKNNTPIGILGIARNINELKHLQDKLEEEKTKYKKLLEHSSDAIFIVNENAKVIESSKQFYDTLGYTKEEALNLYVWDFETIHKKEQILENINKTIKTPLMFDSIYTKKDGTSIDVSIRITSIEINNKTYVYSSFRDITEEKRLQKQLLKQKDEFETIFNYSQDSIIIIDKDFKILTFNDSFKNMTNYSKEELEKINYQDLIAKEDKKKFLNAIDDANKLGHSEYFEIYVILKEYKRVIVSICISVLPDKKSFLLTIKDITSKKAFETQSKLASMGEMIGNIAHQWRQPLSVITMNASGLKLQSQINTLKQEDIDSCVENIMKQANYLSNTIDNFRNFIKGNSKEITLVSINSIIKDTLSLIQASLKNNYIQTVIDIDDYEVFGNKNELIEAFINILNNSKDALKQNIKNEKDRFIFIKSIKHDKECEFLIYDSALGVSKDIIDKIFEPYFTTKHKSNGTGLGLSIVDRILRIRHKAQINVYNKEFIYNNTNYKGLCFSIILKQEN